VRDITKIIIHCSATPHGRDVRAATIRRWHTAPPPVGRGWADIGYHFVICLDGTVENGRPLEKMGAHAANHNAYSVGICMVGGGTGGDAIGRYTPAQWQSLATLVAELEARFSGATVIGHRQVESHKTCPNFDVPAWRAGGMAPLADHVLEATA